MSPVSIGDGQPVFTIAEIGLNHNGDVNIAKKMIDMASKAGCSSVKFQNFETDEVYVKGAKAGKYKLLGKDIPIYDFATHTRLEKTLPQNPKKIILVDGILILGQPNVRKHFDQSIYVHTPEEIRYKRRLTRDIQERGRTPEGVEMQFKSQVKPMHDLFVEPSKKHADIISSGTDLDIFNNILETILKQIREF